MRRLRAWLTRLAGVVTRGRREREFAEEIENHLQLHIADNLRAGMSPDEARRHAVLKLGGIESARQAYRDRCTFPALEHVAQDGRFALRQTIKHPAFATTAVLILALGMGSSVAIFGFVDAALIQPLPYPDPGRLVHVTESVAMIPRANLSYLDYLDWKRLNRVFSSLDVYHGTGFMLKTASGAEPVPAARVSDGFFRTLGVHPSMGREFRPGEDRPGAPKVAILTYPAW
jgi:macrolide transport system ATP-binding/permease protein